jgi:hypothetical protein
MRVQLWSHQFDVSPFVGAHFIIVGSGEYGNYLRHKTSELITFNVMWMHQCCIDYLTDFTEQDKGRITSYYFMIDFDLR